MGLTTPNPWCKCNFLEYGASLGDRLNIFVCGKCWWPSWMVYDASHKYCAECGISFHSPWEENCSACNDALLDLANEVDDEEDRIEILSQYSFRWLDWEGCRAIKQDILASDTWWFSQERWLTRT